MYEITCLYTFKKRWMQWPRSGKLLGLLPSISCFILQEPRVPGTSDKSGHESCGLQKKVSLDINPEKEFFCGDGLPVVKHRAKF